MRSTLNRVWQIDLGCPSVRYLPFKRAVRSNDSIKIYYTGIRASLIHGQFCEYFISEWNRRLRLFIVLRWIRWTTSPKKNHWRGIYFSNKREEKSYSCSSLSDFQKSIDLEFQDSFFDVRKSTVFYPRRLWIKGWTPARGLAAASWTRKKRRRQSVVIERRWSIRWNVRKDRSTGSR